MRRTETAGVAGDLPSPAVGKCRASRVLGELERVLLDRQELVLHRELLGHGECDEATRARAQALDRHTGELLAELREIAPPHGTPIDSGGAPTMPARRSTSE